MGLGKKQRCAEDFKGDEMEKFEFDRKLKGNIVWEVLSLTKEINFQERLKIVEKVLLCLG